ncbi:MAG: type II toxin-antitoxin system VapC family toxin [Kiritimatiellae bacterium]|nr:type II toxin-antitoxin system VapC family toxin [Kiritimatiellia bacterium]MDD4737289.1 type II toxin-antitoxin system VapC family toxin [Kiritimatiellia bacterium]
MERLQMKYLLDTHVWVWWNMHPDNLSSKVYSLLESPENYDEILISAISPWEFSKLIEKKRIGISCNPEEWIAEALRMPKLRLVPLTPRISYHSTVLPQPFHDDPADQIIVATGREENVTLITKDKFIQDYKHIRTLW